MALELEGFRVAYTPGHASHHVCYLHEETGDAYVGDVAGVRIPPSDFTLAPTPPPDIDLEAWYESLQKVEEWDPVALRLTHFGLVTDPVGQLNAMRERLDAVAATAHATQSADTGNPLMSAPVPLESLAVEIAARAQSGSNRFEIRLDPPELGRIDVRLDIDRSGNVTSRLVVDKAETLEALRRDAHQLERALQDAGLKTSDNGLQFSLRDQAFSERQDQAGSDTGTLRTSRWNATRSSPVIGRCRSGF